MCGARRERVRESYEGETTRLTAGGAPARASCGAGGFPWWALWLIWPAVGLVKWSAPLVVGLYGELMAATVPLLPVLLVLIGLALIVRRRVE